MIYYITEINDDTITIENMECKKSIKLEDLANTKDTIVGFNKITGKLKVSSLEEAQNYIIAKYKLVNKENPLYLASHYDIKCLGNGLEVTLSPDAFEYKELMNEFEFGYANMFEQLDEYSKANGLDKSGMPIPLCIKFDLYIKDREIEYQFDNYFQLEDSEGEISYLILGVSFTDRSDIRTVSSLEEIFSFIDCDLEVSKHKVNYLVDSTIDMSNLEYNRNISISNIMSGYVMDIIPPKFIGELSEDETEYKLQSSFELSSYAKLEQFNNLAKEYCPNDRLSVPNCYLKELKLSELQTFRNIRYELFVIELEVDTVIEKNIYKSLDFIYLSGLDDNNILSITFKADVFSFVHNLSEINMHQQIRPQILEEMTGCVNSFKFTEKVNRDKFLSKFRDILKTSGGYDFCKQLTKIYYSNCRHLDLNFGSDFLEYSQNEMLFILRLTVYLLNCEYMMVTTDINIFVCEEFEDLCDNWC